MMQRILVISRWCMSLILSLSVRFNFVIYYLLEDDVVATHYKKLNISIFWRNRVSSGNHPVQQVGPVHCATTRERQHDFSLYDEGTWLKYRCILGGRRAASGHPIRTLACPGFQQL
jgi:hypothetical protein